MFHLILMAAALCAVAAIGALRWGVQHQLRLVVCCAAVLLMPAAAMAATPNTLFDASYWWQFFLAIAAIVVPVILGLVASWAKAHFKLASGSAAANIIDLLVTAGAQAVTPLIAKAPASAVIDVKNAGIASFLTTLSDTTKSAMALKNVTAADLAQRIDGEISLRLGIAAPAAKATQAATGGAPAK